MGSRRRRLATWAAAGLTSCALAGGWAAASADASIRVTTTDGASLASFGKLDCRVDRAGFHARKVSKGWKLVVRVQPFGGFHTYELNYKDGGPAYFTVDPPGGGGTYSNGQVPPTDVPRLTVGGAIGFPKGRKVLGLQFPITYDSSDANPNIARVTGTAPCKFPRRRH